MSYQFLPPLSADEYAALRESIETFGVLQPVVVDDDGNILDGHHRAQVCAELGVDYETVVLPGLSEEQKVEQALTLNLARRHLDAGQRQALVAELRRRGLSVRFISEHTGIPRATVHRVAAGVPDGTPEYVTGRDGKVYRAVRPVDQVAAPGAPFDARGSGQEAWFTPPWLFEGLGLTFDIDVAAPAGGLDWIPARRYFTETDDGLAQPWDGLVWCNPPYSAPTEWCRRFAEQPDMALLIRADLSSGGPFAAVAAADAMWVPDRRLEFVDGVGERGGAVTFSTVLLGRGETVVAAMERLATRRGVTLRLALTGVCG